MAENSINEAEDSHLIDRLDDVDANLVDKSTCEDFATVMAGLEESKKDKLDDIDDVMADVDEMTVRNKIF